MEKPLKIAVTMHANYRASLHISRRYIYSRINHSRGSTPRHRRTKRREPINRACVYASGRESAREKEKQEVKEPGKVRREKEENAKRVSDREGRDKALLRVLERYT